MTCAHSFEENKCSEDLRGRELRLDDSSSSLVGGVAEYDHAMDFAYAPDAYNSDIDGIRNSILNEPYTISGHVSASGIDDLIASDEIVHQYGAASGKTSGQLEEDSPYDRCNNARAPTYVISSANTQSGDSGGPHYRYYDFGGNTYLSIIAPHNGRASGIGDYPSDWSAGCAAYEISNGYGIQFGGTPTC